MECEHGFLEVVFIFLKQLITKSSWLHDCSPDYDSMSIWKQFIWESDKRKYAGYEEIDFGESSELHTGVLVIVGWFRGFWSSSPLNFTCKSIGSSV